MKKFYILTLLSIFFCALGAKSQVIYSDPPILQETTQEITVYFDASDTPLANLSANTKIYAHTGVFTNLSPTKWAHTTTWGGTSDNQNHELNKVSGNLWKLFIPNIRSYYNITNANETVTSLNFVFKTAGKEGAIQSQDLFLPVKSAGLQISLTSNTNGNVITGETGYVKFTLYSTQSAQLSIKVNGSQIVAQGNNTQQIEGTYTFTTPGEYLVSGSATANGQTVSEDIKFIYLPPSQAMDYPGGTPIMGPVANEDGSVTFCIGAPNKDHVVLMGSWNNYQYDYINDTPMYYQDTDNGRYFWTTVEGLDPDTMYVYYYVIDGGLYTVGDPYARLVLDPYNDKYLDTSAFTGLPKYPTEVLNGQDVPVAIYWGNMNQYEWEVENFQIPDKQNLIIYELLFRDFTGTEGQAKGNGTVQQAIQKFDYLKSLGVNAIELLPIMEFNGNISWGYNPNFYFAIDKAYGTPDDYKEFIDLCHQNGMAVILDMVFNQSDGLHPWYQMYPVSKNPFYNMNAPHAYSVLNDWNQGNPMVQEQWADVLRYWMTEYKFDGFRFDLVKGLGLNSSYANNGDAATNAYNKSRVEEMLYLQSVMMEINPDAIFINENLAGAQEENEMAQTSWKDYNNMQMNWVNVNDPACQYAMGYSSGSNMNILLATKNSRVWGSTVSYLESHDEQRLAYKQDQWAPSTIKGNPVTSCQRLGSAAAQMIMTPGSHMIWQFSEMGNAQNTKDNNGGNDTDPKIVNWNLLNEPNHGGLYKNYCQLNEIRFNNPSFFTENANFTINCGIPSSTAETFWGDGSDSQPRSLVSKVNDLELITFINPNCKGNARTYNYTFMNKDNASYQIMAFSYGSNPSFSAANGTITVEPNCFVVIGSASLTPAGIDDLVDESVDETILRVYGATGEIVVDYAPNGVTIYSLDGKVVGSVKESGSVAVASGLYIVKSGKKTVKVIVK